MFYTYPEKLMAQAMDNLGDMYAYAVKKMSYGIDDFQNLFLKSGTAECFEAGSIDLINSMSGAELANYVLWASNLPQHDLLHGYSFTGSEYLAGRAVAMYQRISGWSFKEIHDILPMSRIVELVSVPEMDDRDMFYAISDALCMICNPEAWEALQECEERLYGQYSR